MPGSGYIDADTVLEADADIIGHINGGHTALPLSQIRCLCEGCLRGIEIVHNGNELAGLTALRYAKRMRDLDCGVIEPGRAADFVLMDLAQHSSGTDLLDSMQKGDLPGVGMVIMDGIVRCGRNRNTPPAERVPQVVV